MKKLICRGPTGYAIPVKRESGEVGGRVVLPNQEIIVNDAEYEWLKKLGHVAKGKLEEVPD